MADSEILELGWGKKVQAFCTSKVGAQVILALQVLTIFASTRVGKGGGGLAGHLP